ncbi:hypothetical protein [Enterovibrio norvegicus]|uniref:hypothetical protein n=1 Tax=Enterovibrio norvegicus TaxID=188144 RepID=UPI00352CE491
MQSILKSHKKLIVVSAVLVVSVIFLFAVDTTPIEQKYFGSWEGTQVEGDTSATIEIALREEAIVIAGHEYPVTYSEDAEGYDLVANTKFQRFRFKEENGVVHLEVYKPFYDGEPHVFVVSSGDKLSYSNNELSD